MQMQREYSLSFIPKFQAMVREWAPLTPSLLFCLSHSEMPFDAFQVNQMCFLVFGMAPNYIQITDR